MTDRIRFTRNPDGTYTQVREALSPSEETDVQAERVTRSLANARSRVAARTSVRARREIKALFPSVERDDQAQIIDMLARAIQPSARSSALTTASNVYTYSQTKIAEIRTMTLAQTQAYHADSDPNWPT